MIISNNRRNFTNLDLLDLVEGDRFDLAVSHAVAVQNNLKRYKTNNLIIKLLAFGINQPNIIISLYRAKYKQLELK